MLVDLDVVRPRCIGAFADDPKVCVTLTSPSTCSVHIVGMRLEDRETQALLDLVDAIPVSAVECHSRLFIEASSHCDLLLVVHLSMAVVSICSTRADWVVNDYMVEGGKMLNNLTRYSGG